MLSLEGKRVLVTGGAVRLGRKMVEALQAEGASVVVHANRSVDEAGALSSQVVQGRLPEDIPAILAAAGPLDILINNAAVFRKDRLPESTPERLHREFEVNLFAPLELIRLFAEQLEGRRGAVINIIDRRYRSLDPSCVPYLLSKKGLADLTRLAALEYAPRIQVNGVAPGPVLPPPNGSEIAREASGNLLLDHAPTPDDVADTVLFLLKSSSITGEVICVDGGQHLIN